MNKPFGYIILESAHEDNTITNLEVIDKGQYFSLAELSKTEKTNTNETIIIKNQIIAPI